MFDLLRLNAPFSEPLTKFTSVVVTSFYSHPFIEPFDRLFYKIDIVTVGKALLKLD